MNATVISSIITGACTIGASVATYVLTRSSEYRHNALLPKDRRHAREGLWTGQIEKHLPKPGTPDVYRLSVSLQISGKRVLGDATSSVQIEGKPVEQPFKLSGGFLDNKYLKMDYLSRMSGILEFGSFIAELDSEGRVLHGRFIGYGRRTSGLISGVIRLEKAA